jgi:predicted nucleic acid-binding protein
MTAFVDTNVLVRHLTGDPPDQAARAARYLATADDLLLPDLILAEVAYVLESYYEAPRDQVATYDVARLDFADAYLVASAERTGVGAIASFDRSVDRVPTVRRVEPG